MSSPPTPPTEPTRSDPYRPLRLPGGEPAPRPRRTVSIRDTLGPPDPSTRRRRAVARRTGFAAAGVIVSSGTLVLYQLLFVGQPLAVAGSADVTVSEPASAVVDLTDPNLPPRDLRVPGQAARELPCEHDRHAG